MLETSRLIIAPLKIEEAEAFYEMLTNNFNRIKESFPKTSSANTSLADSRKYIQEKIVEFENKTFFSFGICLKEENKLIGQLAIKNIDWSIPKGELGYFIDQTYEGKGIVTEALQKVIHYAFTDLKMNKLFLRTLLDNVASQKVAEKNGFIKEGILRKEFKSGNNKLEDVIYYARLNPNI